MGKGMLIEGAVSNEETGENLSRKHYLLDTGFQVTTIVWITWIESYVHSDINLQVKVESLALDSYAFVFEVSMEFNPDSKEEMDTLLRDLRVGGFCLVQGPYGGLWAEAPRLVLYDPSYRPVEPEFSEEEIRKAFQMNSK